jgi:hypothetical protein
MKTRILSIVIGLLIVVLIASFINTKSKFTILNVEGFTLGSELGNTANDFQEIQGTDAYSQLSNLSGSYSNSISNWQGLTGAMQAIQNSPQYNNFLGSTAYANYQTNGFTGTVNNIQNSPQYNVWQSNGGITGFVEDVELNGITSTVGSYQEDVNSFLAPVSTSNTNSYVYDHTTKQDNVIIFYGVNNSTANVTNVTNTLQINVNYGTGSTETYTYSKMYDDQIIFISSTNTSNSAVLVKTNNSMILTVYSGGNTYTFYPNISNSRNQLATYINEYYYGNTGSVPISSYPVNPPVPPPGYDYASRTPPPPGYDYASRNPDYSNYLPPGIPKSAIPYGKEDLYILKSEVVPPVCPACPPSIIIPGYGSTGTYGGIFSGLGAPPPCPACERCPEPIVDCKKVVKYRNGKNEDYHDYSQYPEKSESYESGVNKPLFGFSSKPNLAKKGQKYTSQPPTSDPDDEGPMPVLNSFSSFGL